MKRLLPAIAALALAGCANIDLSNRISRTADCQKVLTTSMWQFFGVTTEVDKRDADSLLKGCKP
jgi:outer membrane lipoprotein SlyB